VTVEAKRQAEGRENAASDFTNNKLPAKIILSQWRYYDIFKVYYIHEPTFFIAFAGGNAGSRRSRRILTMLSALEEIIYRQAGGIKKCESSL